MNIYKQNHVNAETLTNSRFAYSVILSQYLYIVLFIDISLYLLMHLMLFNYKYLFSVVSEQRPFDRLFQFTCDIMCGKRKASTSFLSHFRLQTM